MNESKTYQLIAVKLESLPVPDMADRIWARIEAQLDIDLPPDSSNNDPGPAPAPKPGGRRIAVGTATIAVAVAIFQLLFNRNENLQTTPFIPEQNQTNTIQPDTAFTFSKPPSEETRNHSPLRTRAILVTENGKTDSSSYPVPVSNTPDKKPDIGKDTTPLVIPPVVLQPAGDTMPAKRLRGVPLKESDYRIVPKKDSR